MAVVETRNHIQYGATVELVTILCANCSVPFAIPLRLQQERRNDHEGFYCPHGHSNVYRGKSEKEILADEKAQLERELKAARDSREYHMERANNLQNSNRSLRGVVTKKRKELNRVKNGVCPCCTRSFANLARHMENKHPQFQKAE